MGSDTSALRRIGAFLVIALVMIAIEVAAAAFVAADWQPPPELDSPDVRSDLWLSRDGAWFGGLPFGGRLLDPKLMTLWLMDHKGVRAADYKKKELETLNKKVEDSFTWRFGLMRWVYRLFGSDFIGFAMLTLSYSVFVYCFREYWRLGRHFRRLHGFWQQPDPNNLSRPRKERSGS